MTVASTISPQVQQLLASAVSAVGDRKFDVTDVTDDLRRAATAWLLDYAGDFEFLLDVRSTWAARGGRQLTDGQAKGVLNCIRTDILRAQRNAVAQAVPVAEGRVDFKAIPDGRYAVEHGGEIAYYVVGKESRNGSRKRHICILASDERIYTGTILPNGEYRGKHEHLIRQIAQDPRAAGLLFGQTIGKCCRCGRTLTDASSREAGIGPECANKGW